MTAAVLVIVAVGLAHHFLGIDLPGGDGGPVSLCPFRAATGLPCPGCGMTRAMVSLGRLDLDGAMRLHPFSLPLLAGMVFFAVTGRVPLGRHHGRLARAGVVALLVLWVARLAGRAL